MKITIKIEAGDTTANSGTLVVEQVTNDVDEFIIRSSDIDVKLLTPGPKNRLYDDLHSALDDAIAIIKGLAEDSI